MKTQSKHSKPLSIRLCAYLMCLQLALQPLMLHAQTIEVDERDNRRAAQIDQAANGTPVVNITAPSAGGVSHNQFLQFNVGQQGLILNNSHDNIVSQLGGAVQGNANLSSGSARLILNEVTGANRSELRGYTEIAGQSAEYILANPYGITCDGCGFINTPDVTLTTGVAEFSNGSLQNINVNQGDILIEGLGLDASRVDHFSIITRAVEINAQIVARDLNLLLGRNEYHPNDKTYTPISGSDSNAPQFALDASALGAMYANQITLIGTEAGVGVRMQGNMAADTGDIRITADGRLELAETQSNQNIVLNSTSGDIELNNLTYASGDLDITANGQVDITDFSAAKNNITINASRINQQGSLVAGLNENYSLNPNGDLSLTANDAINNTGVMVSSRGTVITGSDITNSGRIEVAGSLQVDANSLNNDDGDILSTGNAQTHITLTQTLSNQQGSIQSNADEFSINAANLNNSDGELIHTGDSTAHINVSDQLINQDGLLRSNADSLSIQAQSLINNDGDILHAGGNELSITVVDQLLNQNASIQSNANVTINSNQLNNQGGLISSNLQLLLNIDGLLDNSLNTNTNQGGVLEAYNNIDLTAGALNNASGWIRSIGNDSAFNTMALNINGSLDNRSGAIEGANEHITIFALGDVDNRNAGAIRHSGTGLLDIRAATLSNAGLSDTELGRIVTNGALSILADRLLNQSYSILSSNNALNLQATNLIDNQGGSIATGAEFMIDISSGQLINDNGSIVGEGTNDSRITAIGIRNNSGEILSNAFNLTLNSGSGDLINSASHIAHAGDGLLDIIVTNLTNSNEGTIASGAHLTVNGFSSFNNNSDAVIFAEHLELDGVTINNSGGNLYAIGNNSMLLNASTMNNVGGMVHSVGSLTTTLNSLNNRNGILQSQNNVELTLSSFDSNQINSLINAGNHLTLNFTSGFTISSGIELIAYNDFTIHANGSVDNYGTLSTGGDLTLDGTSLINRSSGVISSEQDLILDFSGDINNQGGKLIASNSLTLSAASFYNTGLSAAGVNNTVNASNVYNYNTLFAGNHLNLYVSGTVGNYDGADLFAMGNIYIGADSNDSRSSRIINRSSTIEAMGSISLYANRIDNIREAGSMVGTRTVNTIISNPTFYTEVRYNSATGTLSPTSPGSRCSGSFGDATIAFCRNRIRATSEEYELNSSPNPAHIIAGGGINAGFGTLNNTTSHIAANGNILLQGTTLNNYGIVLEQDIQTERMRQSYNLGSAEPWPGGGRLYEYQRSGSPTFDGVVGTGSRTRDFITATIYSGQVVSVNAIGSINNTNGGDYNETSTNPDRRTASVSSENTSAQDQNLQSTVSLLAPDSADHQSLSETVSDNISEVTALQDIVFNPADNLTLPNSGGLFVTNTDPNSSFLVETNPDLLNLNFFQDDLIGSDFLEEQLELINNNLEEQLVINNSNDDNNLVGLFDPNITTRRLGDAFYETRLVRDAILQTTGLRYLNDDINSDAEQMRFLMTNAIAAQQAMQLTYGVALNEDQVAQLTHDIIWMVEQEIQGQKVLVPVYYAASLRNGDIGKSGALILGDTVELNVSDGGVVNLGTISAKDRLNINAAQSLLNTGIISASNEVTLTAGEGLHNMRGRISTSHNGNMLLVSRNSIANDGIIQGGFLQLTSQQGGLENSGGSITAQRRLGVTTLSDINLNSDSGTFTSAGDMQFESTGGSINVGNIEEQGERYNLSAGGNIDLTANQNLNITDSELNAGGSIGLNATDINLNARRLESESQSTQGNTQTITKSVSHRVTELNAGGNVLLNAENDINSEAAQVNADQSIVLNAGGDINLLAVQNEAYSFEKTVKKKSFGKKKTTIEEHHTIQAQGTQLSAGGHVLMNVEVNGDGSITTLDSGSVNLEGTQIDAGGTVLIAADEDVNIFAAKDYEYHRTETHKKGSLGLKKKSTGDITQRSGLAASTLQATDDLSVISDDNINIVASDLQAGGDITLQAYNDVLIAAGEVTETQEQWSEDTGMFSDGNLYSTVENREGTTSILAQGASVNAGQNIDIRAGSATVIGSDLMAGNSINAETDVGDIEILASAESTEHYTHEKRVSVSLGDAIEGMSNPDEMISDDDHQLTIKLADAQYDAVDTKTSELSHRSSNLIANNNIVLDSAGDIFIEGSNLAADADMSGDGTVALMADADITIQEAENRLDTQSKETHGSATMSVVVQHQAVEVVKAIKDLKDAKDQLKQAKKDYRQYEKDLKKLKADLAVLEQEYKDNTPGVTLDDLIEMRELVEETEDDENWYKAGVVAAGANLASKITLLAQQTAAAAQSTGTYGFNAGVQLDIEASKTESETHQTTSVASNISGQNILIQTGTPETKGQTTTTIQGSHLNASDTIAIDTGDLNILASKDTYESSQETKSGHITIAQTVYGAAGGPTVNASFNRSQASDKQTTFNNSTLTAGTVDITTIGDMILNGGNVHARDNLVAVIGGDLTIESKQNRSRSKELGLGISGGVSLSGGNNSSVTGVNAGFNSSNSSSYSKETVLSSLTSGGTADITVDGHTQITGALLATIDEEGNDLGNLNLTTNTLGYADLTNINHSQEKSIGINTSIGLNGSNSNDPASENASGIEMNTSGIQYSNSSNHQKDKTLATLGQGNINILDQDNSDDLAQLNRDTSNTTKEIYDVERQRGNIDLTIDHNLLSEEGRKEIKEDFKRSELLGQSILDVATEESVQLKDTFQHIGDVQKDLDVQKLLATQNGGEHAKVLNDLANATPEQKQEAVNAYAQAYAQVYGISIDQAQVIAVNQFVAGAHHGNDGQSDIYINDNIQNNALDYANTIGHEVTHAQIEQDAIRDRGNDELNEAYSDIRGNYAADNYGFSFANNGLGTVNTGLTNNRVGNADSALLNQNNEQFQQLDPTELDYRQLHTREQDIINNQLAAHLVAAQCQQGNCISEAQAVDILTAEALRRVSGESIEPANDPELARAANNLLRAAGYTLLTDEDGQPVKDRYGNPVPTFGTSSVSQRLDNSIFAENQDQLPYTPPQDLTAGDAMNYVQGRITGTAQGTAETATGIVTGIYGLVTSPVETTTNIIDSLINLPQTLEQQSADYLQAAADGDWQAVGEMEGQHDGAMVLDVVGASITGRIIRHADEATVGTGVDGTPNAISDNIDSNTTNLARSNDDPLQFDTDAEMVGQPEIPLELARFETNGKLIEEPETISVGQDMIEEYMKMGNSYERSVQYTQASIASGTDIPVKVVTEEALYKVVPKGSEPSPYTVFWYTKNDLDQLLKSPNDFARNSGLPLESNSIAYDIYEMKPKEPATVFQNQVADTVQGAYRQNVNATQTLVPNRSQFAKPKKVSEFKVGD